MIFFKENQFNNQSTVDYYMKKFNPPNAPLWFNVKTWLSAFTKQVDKQNALNIMNPLNFEFPVFGYDWQVHAWKNKKDSPEYTHLAGGKERKSFVHENGYAIDFASNNHIATYSFFRYLKTLQKRGAKFRILLSLHNHHIHIDNYPENFGFCGVELKDYSIAEYDENADNDLRKWYNIALLPEDEGSNELDKYFGLNKATIILSAFLFLFALIILKGGSKNGAS